MGFVAVVPAAASAAGSYSIAAMGAFPGGSKLGSEAYAVNGSGQIVGSSGISVDQVRGFSYTPSAGMVNLGVLPGGSLWSSQAFGVNDNGEVVGASSTAHDRLRSFSYTPSGGMVDLGRLPGGYDSTARGVNDSGQIVGDSTIGSTAHAFSYTSSRGMVDLGRLPGATGGAVAFAVNNSGEIVGDSGTAGGAAHAFSYTPAGGMVDLGTLPGVSDSRAVAVNDEGEIVGYGGTGVSEHAFSYTPSGGMVDLGRLPGGTGALAYGVNDSGQIVGTSLMANGDFHAFSYTPAGGMVDLGTLPGDSDSSALGVNDQGEIVGSSTNAAGVGHAVLWQMGRPTTTSVNCSPQNIVAGQSTTCTATVSDAGGGAPATPTGTVSFGSDSPGNFVGGTCALSGNNGTANCQVSYTPTAVASGQHELAALYAGDTASATSSGQTVVTVARRVTSTSVSCAPSTALVLVATTCTATVTDIDLGTPTTPTGKVTFATNKSGKFSAESCSLADAGTSATCRVTYTAHQVVTGQHTITASYGGASAHASGGGQTILEVLGRSTSTTLVCEQATLAVGQSTTCTATVTDTSAGQAITPSGAVKLKGSKTDSFTGSPCKLSGSDGTATCQVTYRPVAVGNGAHTITASYVGDTRHQASTGQTTIAVSQVGTT
jgi:probable HAF family extracellular repeat protein